MCGPNAECSAVDHTNACQCVPGYEGTPSDYTLGCRPTPVNCDASSDCPHNTYCYQQICRRKFLKSHYLKKNISSFFTYCRFLLLNKVILILSLKLIDLCLVVQPGVSRTASVAWRSSVCKASVATPARREGCAAWTQSVASTTTSSSAAVRQASRATIPLNVSEVSYRPRHQFF